MDEHTQPANKHTHCNLLCHWCTHTQTQWGWGAKACLHPPPLLLSKLSAPLLPAQLHPFSSSSLPQSSPLSSSSSSSVSCSNTITYWWQIWWQMFTVKQISQILSSAASVTRSYLLLPGGIHLISGGKTRNDLWCWTSVICIQRRGLMTAAERHNQCYDKFHYHIPGHNEIWALW